MQLMVDHSRHSTQLSEMRTMLDSSVSDRFPVQRVIDTAVDDNDNWSEADDLPSNGFAGLPGTASKAVLQVGATSAPADVAGMARWREAGYLKDPARGGNQTLTRMHAIRGRFGGPSAANNMFLGTAPSNNFNDNSHYRLVERPLEQYLNGEGDETRAFSYAVTPHTNNIPAYIQNRIEDDVDGDHEAEFTAFANSHLPNGFLCEATLYWQEPANDMVDDSDDEDTVIWKKDVSQEVSTTIDADEGNEDDD